MFLFTSTLSAHFLCTPRALYSLPEMSADIVASLASLDGAIYADQSPDGYVW